MRTLKKKRDDHAHATSSSTSTSTSTVSPPATRSALDLILASTTLRATAARGQASSGTAQQSAPKPPTSQWVSVLEGYVILRDLERYLSRLVRDYTLLRTKS